ncbi:hypothetical protein [Thomasclavelia sp.]
MNVKNNDHVDGSVLTPYHNRVGSESIVYFTRDLSEKGLQKVYDKIQGVLMGKVGIKLHTGEAHGPNIIPLLFHVHGLKVLFKIISRMLVF